jgi:cardiolipin synthase
VGALADLFDAVWPHLLTVLTLAASVAASVHAVLTKREVRAAIGWVAVVWLTPIVGPILYWLLGINRIRRRARDARRGADRQKRRAKEISELIQLTGAGSIAEIGRVIDRVGHLPRTKGNRLRPLVDGAVAYDEMVGAIERARRSVALASYIFEGKGPGARFVAALSAAHARGVVVRVLLDDVGARYSAPPVDRALARNGVRTARFMRVWRPRFFPYFNLRNHRKILVVDGMIGFTGGLNIREVCDPADGDLADATRDLHFRVEGPLVAQLAEIFAEDWAFTTGEKLAGDAWFPPSVEHGTGPTIARAISEGPDQDFEKIRWSMLAAIGCARRSIRIATPYFLPDDAITDLLQVAALRGVDVDVMVPARSNLWLVQWAMNAEMEHVLAHDVRVWLGAAPFDHSKLVVVDEEWVLLGSSNWDPRSLRLNFELNVECFDRELGAEMSALFDSRKQNARPLDGAELRRRGALRRLRDAFARLLTPYL